MEKIEPLLLFQTKKRSMYKTRKNVYKIHETLWKMHENVFKTHENVYSPLCTRGHVWCVFEQQTKKRENSSSENCDMF